MRKALRVVGTMAVAFIAIVMVGGWLLVRDEVAAVRAIAAKAVEPLPRNVRSAIIAAEDPIILERPRFSLSGMTAVRASATRALLAHRKGGRDAHDQPHV